VNHQISLSQTQPAHVQKVSESLGPSGQALSTGPSCRLRDAGITLEEHNHFGESQRSPARGVLTGRGRPFQAGTHFLGQVQRGLQPAMQSAFPQARDLGSVGQDL
jgi:hypothetical protein